MTQPPPAVRPARVLRTLAVLCALLAGLDLLDVAGLWHFKHPHFAFERLPGFHALFTLVSCGVLVVVARVLRGLVRRPEEYWESRAGEGPLPVIGALPPALVLVVGAAGALLFRGRALKAWPLAVPVAGLVLLPPLGTESEGVRFLGQSLVLVRMDGLSRVFAGLFLVAAFLAFLAAAHVRDRVEHAAAMLYVAGAVGAVTAGDLLTLFLFWELMAVSSVVLVWARRTPRSAHAGVRYLVVQVASGLLLLVGALQRLAAGESLRFDAMVENGAPSGAGAWTILLALGVKAAFPGLHSWLTDAYPEATATGAIFLGSFTTKAAIYTLLRGYPGCELLVPIGVVMAAWPVVASLVENDLRRVLCHSLITQLGFMVVGVGIGTSLSLNAAVAHAVCHVLYKGLLFTCLGAVVLRAGTADATDLGGLHRTMPRIAWACVVGAASLSAVPLFAAFVSKSLLLTAVAEAHRPWAWLGLLFAAACALHQAGIRVPWLAFFREGAGLGAERRAAVAGGEASAGGEAPANLVASAWLGAGACVLLGFVPGLLFAVLPGAPVTTSVYSAGHVASQLQLLAASALAFVALHRLGVYPALSRGLSLDVDWVVRRPAGAVAAWLRSRGEGTSAPASARRGAAWAAVLAPRLLEGVRGEMVERAALVLVLVFSVLLVVFMAR